MKNAPRTPHHADDDPVHLQAQSVVEEMDLRTLAGRLVMGGFQGTTMTPELREMLVEHRLGGVVLFRRNVESPEQLLNLTNSIRSTSKSAGRTKPHGGWTDPSRTTLGQYRFLRTNFHGTHKVQPPMVAIDQEGGRVARLGPPFTVWPPMALLGKSGDKTLAYQVGTAFAQELATVGVNWDFAPVADVHTNPDNPIIGDRAFSDDPRTAGEMATAFALGMQARGVAACMKHFPGHGDTVLDSHLALPTINHDSSRLHSIELEPFRQGIRAGVASIMTAHILFPALDPQRPATLSPRLVKDLLRREMGYDGVVVSDDLEMAAIAGRHSIEDCVAMGLEAGLDLFLICQSAPLLVKAVDTMVHLVKSGEVPRHRLEESATRLEVMKLRFPPYPPSEMELGERLAQLGNSEHQRLASRMME